MRKQASLKLSTARISAKDSPAELDMNDRRHWRRWDKMEMAMVAGAPVEWSSKLQLAGSLNTLKFIPDLTLRGLSIEPCGSQQATTYTSGCQQCSSPMAPSRALLSVLTMYSPLYPPSSLITGRQHHLHRNVFSHLHWNFSGHTIPGVLKEAPHFPSTTLSTKVYC